MAKCDCFDRFEKDLDEFNLGDVVVKRFKEFSFLVKVILTLSYGLTSIERSFSINNKVLRQIRKKSPLQQTHERSCDY